MAERRTTVLEDVKEALDLIQKGQLYALQNWARLGNRLRTPEDPDSGEQFLLAAAQTGFHSMVAELLQAGGWSQEALASALEIAFKNTVTIWHFDLDRSPSPQLCEFSKALP